MSYVSAAGAGAEKDILNLFLTKHEDILGSINIKGKIAINPSGNQGFEAEILKPTLTWSSG